jgi:mono/diheme cytochrome c family protein
LPLIGVATPGVDCNPLDPSGPVLQDALSVLWGNGGLAWNLLNVPIVSDQQIEERKIYNTKLYSQGNGGHEFTSVLNDVERRAIKEYLKTL